MPTEKRPHNVGGPDRGLSAGAENWMARLNAMLAGEVKIFCQNREDPRVVNTGEFPLSAEQQGAAEKHRPRLAALGVPNEQSAVLVNDPVWDSSPVCLEARWLDFASVCALRDEGLAPQLLSACGVLVCGESEEMILNQRSKAVATYPGRIHIFGGVYWPPVPGGADFDRGGLRSTLEREVREETQLSLPKESSTPSMMAKELGTGFIQLVFLGFRIPQADISRAQGSWEGRVLFVPFAALGDLLRERSRWVPSGMAHVLAWLALGAPGADPGARFGDSTAGELFEAVVSGA